MLDDVIAFLDRRYASLCRHAPLTDYLLHLDPFVAALDRDPRLRGHLDEMMADAVRAHEAANEENRKLVERIKAIRDKVPPRPEDDAEDESREQRYGLRSFDHAASQKQPVFMDRLRDGGDADDFPAVSLAFHLRNRLQFAYPNRDAGGKHLDHGTHVSEMFGDLARINADAEHARKKFSVLIRTSGTFALAKLRVGLRQLNPTGVFDPGIAESIHEHMTPVMGDPDILRGLLHGSSSAPDPIRQQLAVDTVRSLVERVYEELRGRIGTALSLRALVLRFKQRAEAYDHEALCAIASSRTIKRKEDRLAERLAAFLFDEGLTPLTRPIVGRLSPDIVAPHLYIEAKQYGDAAGARKAIKEGAKQVWDTFNRLRGTPHEVREAYLVIFRRKGASIVFEKETIHAAGAALHAILVDVAPNDSSGSRQKHKPIAITEADLAPVRLNGGHGRARSGAARVSPPSSSLRARRRRRTSRKPTS